MTPRITLLITAAHVLLFLLLSLRVVFHRKAKRIGVGTGGDEVLTRKVRVHANFGEYVPLALLLLGLLEVSAIDPSWIWVFGVALLIARIAHAIGLGGSAGVSIGRFGGTLLTFAVLLTMALTGLWRFFAT